MSIVTLLDIYPRDPATGAEVRQLFVHNAVIRAVFFGLQWQPTIVALPKIEAALGLGESSFGRGAVPAVGQVQIAIPDGSPLAGLIWRGARGFLGSAPMPRTSADPLDSDFSPGRPVRVDTVSIERGILTLNFIDAGAPLRISAAALKFGSTGNAALDGAGADLNGKIVPVGYGELLNVPAMLIDRVYNIWLLIGRPAIHIHALYDGGAPLTAGTIRTDLAALRYTAPADGCFDWCLNADGLTLVRPWTSPVYPLTADLRATGPLTAAGIVEALVTSRTTVPMKAGTVAALDALNGGWHQLYLADETQIDETLDQLLAGISSWWRIDATGALELGRYDYAASAKTFGATDVISVKREAVLPPTRRHQLGYARNWRVQSESEIASAVLEAATTYSWYAWANSPDGYIDFTTGLPGDRAFQGIAANRLSETPGTDPDDYIWTPYKGPPAFGLVVRGAAVLASDLIIFNGGVWGGGGGWTTQGYRGGAVLGFRAIDVPSGYMVGLNSDPSADDNYTSIDYAIYVTEQGGAYIYESGAAVGPIVGNGGVGESSFSIAYDNRTVRYYVYGALVREVYAGPDRTFWGDMAGYGGRVRITSWGAQGAIGTDGTDGEDALTISVQPGAIVIRCNSAGVPLADELPQSIQLTVYSGDTDVTAPATYASSASGLSGFVDNGGGNFSFSGVTADKGYCDIQASYAGKVGRVRVPVSRVKSGASANRAVDKTLTRNGNNTYVGVQGGPLVLAVGPGVIVLSVYCAYVASTSSCSLAGKFQYRTTPGAGAWSDVGAEFIDDAISTPTEPSVLQGAQSLAGPASPENWEFQVLSRKRTGTGNPNPFQTVSDTFEVTQA